VEPERPVRRLVVMVDLENYSGRDNLRQLEAQRGLVHVMTHAALHAGLDRSCWDIQPQGDGELDILPQETEEPRVVGDFIAALDGHLTVYNRDLIPGARLRLRVAMDHGIVHFGHNGYPGATVVRTARMLDSPELRSALAAASGANLALMVSGELFDQVVRHGYPGVRPEEYAAADIEVKGLRCRGWIRVPGHTRESPADDETAPRPDPARQATKTADSPVQRVASRDYMEFHGKAIVTHAEGDITINSDPGRW
jgi:hypothetical protein